MVVECIDDNFGKNDEQIDHTITNFKELPMKGKEYEVRAYVNIETQRRKTVGLTLVGVDNDIYGNGIECNFSIERFRILSL